MRKTEGVLAGYGRDCMKELYCGTRKIGANLDVRLYMMLHGVRMYEVAEKYGYAASTMSLKLMEELGSEEKDRVYAIVDELSEDLNEEACSASIKFATGLLRKFLVSDQDLYGGLVASIRSALDDCAGDVGNEGVATHIADRIIGKDS